MMTAEQRAREFVTAGFRSLGVPSLEPYIRIIAELIDGAEQVAAAPLRKALIEARNELLFSRAACKDLIPMANEIGQDRAPADKRLAELDGLLTRIDLALSGQSSSSPGQ